MFPFDYEPNEDYWPLMTQQQMNIFQKDKKLAINSKRLNGVTKQMTLVQKRLTKEIDKSILSKLEVERENFKKIITGSLQANYQNPMPIQSQGPAKVIGITRSTTLAAHAPKVEIGEIKEGKNEELEEEASSQQSNAEGKVKEPGSAMQYLTPTIRRDEDDTSEFSPLPGMLNYRQPQVQILKETNIVNHVQSIRRTVESDEYRRLKKLVLTYMEQGRQEFQRQTDRWQELVTELGEDLKDLQGQVAGNLSEFQSQLGDMSDQIQIQTANTDSKMKDMRKFIERTKEQLQSQAASPTKLQRSSVRLLESPIKVRQQAASVEPNKAAKQQEVQKPPDVVIEENIDNITDLIKGSQANLDSEKRDTHAQNGKDPKSENLAQSSAKKLEKKASMESSLKTSYSGSANQIKVEVNEETAEKEKKVSLNENLAKKQSTKLSDDIHSSKEKLVDKEQIQKERERRKTASELQLKSIMKKHRPGSNNVSVNKPSFSVKVEEQPRQNSESQMTDQDPEDREMRVVSKKLQEVENIPKRHTQPSAKSSSPTTLPKRSKANLNSQPTKKVQSIVTRDPDQKQSNLFTKGFNSNRQTATREETMKFVSRSIQFLKDQIKDWIKVVDERHREMKHDKEQTILQCHRFKSSTVEQQNQFFKDSSERWEAEGLKMQRALLDRMDRIDSGHAEFEKQLAQNRVDVQNVIMQIEKEYREFTTQRVRWKSDFVAAKNNATKNLQQIEDIVSGCLKQNEFLTKAVKMVLDTQMMDHLIQRQDIEDRKKLMLLGANPAEKPSTVGSGLTKPRSTYSVTA